MIKITFIKHFLTKSCTQKKTLALKSPSQTSFPTLLRHSQPFLSLTFPKILDLYLTPWPSTATFAHHIATTRSLFNSMTKHYHLCSSFITHRSALSISQFCSKSNPNVSTFFSLKSVSLSLSLSLTQIDVSLSKIGASLFLSLK